MAVWPWYGTLAKKQLYEAGEFLQVQAYTNILRWTDQIAQRPALKRGRVVNRTWGQPSSQHDGPTAPSPRRARILLAGRSRAT